MTPRWTCAPCVPLLLWASLAGAQPAPRSGRAPDRPARLSIIYTGRSLGALGVLRDPDEHGLLIEEANRTDTPLRLATFTGWRTAGVAIFTAAGDLEAADLEAFLTSAPSVESLGRLPALRSNNVTMLQDPSRPSPDLLAMTRSNARTPIDFPDLVDTTLFLGRVHVNGHDVLIVAEQGLQWPDQPAAWTQGEVNRIDVGDGTLFELPVNLGQMGPRATLIAEAIGDARARGAHPVVIDLGERDGDLGLARSDRARVDYSALRALGYSLVLPYEFELALGAQALSELAAEFPEMRFVATNVTAAGFDDLLVTEQVIEVDGLRVGLFGIVDPALQDLLARASLADFAFEDPVAVATRATARLRADGVDAVVMLSNLHPRDNALVAREVMGIDAIVTDLHVRWSPEAVTTTVELPGRPRTRPGSPALVPRSFANGLSVGHLELEFNRTVDDGFFLASLSHNLESVTDRTRADSALVDELRAMARLTARPRGDVLLPAFGDLVARRPSLAEYDSTTAQGRISKRQWEELLARLIRYRGGAEVGVIRKLPHFPPAIGALREADVRAWLWTEDNIVLLDLSGVELRTLLEEDVNDDLVTSGIDRRAQTIHGRRIDNLTFYRIATTDLLYEGARASAFSRARRVQRTFDMHSDGMFNSSGSGQPLPLRAFVLRELGRLRNSYSGDVYLDGMAALLDRDPPFEPLFTFEFDRPTVFGTLNRVINTEAFGASPETRVTSNDSTVVGASGRFQFSWDLQRYGFDAGVATAFSRLSGRRPGTNHPFKLETADDLQLDLTLRRKLGGGTSWQPQPFVRTVFDTEFTPTVNPRSGILNPRQTLIRGLGGVLASPGRWDKIELSLLIEQDLAFDSIELGLEFQADYRRRFGPLGALQYRFNNHINYFFPADSDDVTDLGLTYGMVHEILIPLVDELSLSVAADVFVFRGKLPATRTFGASAILRIGLTYDRLWKPRYQPFF